MIILLIIMSCELLDKVRDYCIPDTTKYPARKFDKSRDMIDPIFFNLLRSD